ncbi:MAG: S-methyl-5-thioribose-1-phosphate isomerase, partial [Firmicutes bacterium]|nr:S-methyl-5-thioribose-1-phosphate isomerase [Bacillota bacterium]
MDEMARPHTINWQDNKLYLLDQRKLPISVEYKCCETAEDVADAIKSLLVRGAPAIGAAAAYGLVLAALKSTPETIREDLNRAANLLAGTRPTAVNLFWAIEKMMAAAAEEAEYSAICRRLQQKADEIMELDVESNRAIGRFGAELLPDDARIMTICNAGALATADYGTALGVIRAAKEAGKHVTVYALETRPVLQGARLTAWELMEDGIDVTLICDNMAGAVMAEGKVNAVIAGADRIA